MRIPREVTIAAATLLVATAEAAARGRAVRSARDAGFVVNVVGTWTMDGAASDVALAQPVPAGVRLSCRAADDGRCLVTVALWNGSALSRDCDGDPHCSLIVPSHPSLGPGGRLVRRIARSLRHETRYARVMSRGGPIPLRDAIAARRGDHVDLGGLLRDVPTSDVLLEVRSAVDDLELPVATVRLAWRAGTRGRVRAPELQRGAYRVIALRPWGSPPTPLGSEALLLVLAPEDAAGALRVVTRAEELASGWDDAAARDAFLHGCLVMLAPRAAP